MPPRLATWAADLLGGPIPREEHATCGACAMLSDGSDPEGVSFNPIMKCCTYVPEVPNFSVGAILSGPTEAHGPTSIRARIAKRWSVTPIGIGHAPHERDPRNLAPAFGLDPQYTCDHYVDGCTIWQHRDSVCSTYFCKIGRGRVGFQFWGSMRRALGAIERAVARGVALRAGLSEHAAAALSALEPVSKLPSGIMDDATYRAIWGEWYGKEETFYAECTRVADALTWDDVKSLGGAEVAALAAAARASYEALLAPNLPANPVARTIMIRPAGENQMHVVAYSQIDPITLPPAVVAALSHFDGRPREDALRAARERERVALSDSLVQTLSDFGVLEDAGGQTRR